MDKIEIHEKCPDCGAELIWLESGCDGVMQYCRGCNWDGSYTEIQDMVDALTAAERRAKIAEHAIDITIGTGPGNLRRIVKASLLKRAEAELYPDEMARETEEKK
jgi:hypothetical protein